MVSRQVVQVLIEAEENVSKAAKKAESALSKLGKIGSKAVNAITNGAGKVQNAFGKIHSFVDRAREKFTQFMSSSNRLGTIKTHISNAANSFGELIRSSNLASRAMEKIKSVSDGVQAKFTNLGSKIRGFGSNVKSSLTSAFSFSGIKQKLSGIGTSIDNLKAKLKSLAAEAKKTGGMGGLGFLKNAASMTVGMLGYDLVNSVMESARASLNARSSIQAFAGRLKMSGAEVTAFQQSLDDLQSTYKKIDMDVVGQQATDMAFRLGLPKSALSELTETTAIFTDAMQRNGRSAEDAMLAMSDAMDGQFVRLKEIGISQEDLMRNGWSGDINDKTGLLNAMNKALKEQHYDELAKSVDTLDDAWKVLSVTLGNLLEAVLLPLTPAIVSIVEGLTSVVSGIMGFVNQVKTAFSGLPEWAQIAIGVGILAVAIGILIPAMGGLGAIAAAITGPLYAVAGAVMAISWPVVAVVAAVALLVAAIYEIGKAFGWWSDVNTMFEAISAGLQRMWDAFINHPDVQALISAISGALSWLSDAIGGAIDSVLQFFGVSSGGEWDIVGQIIQGVGIAWQIMTSHIRLAIQVVQMIIGVFQSAYESIVSFGSYIMDILSPAFSMLGELWGGLVEAVQPIITVFQQFMTGQTDLLTVITTVATTMWNLWITLTSNLGNLILTLVSNLLTWAIQGGLNFLTGISTYLMQVPTRVGTFLAQTLSRIISYGARWVSQARAKASQVLSGVVSFLRQLPSRALSALMGVVSSIVSAGAQWISNAKSKAKSVVDGVGSVLSRTASAVSSALNGVVDAVVKPFRDAYNTAKGWWDKIASLGNNAAGFDFTWTPPSAAGFELNDVNIGANNVSTSGSGVQRLELEANLTHDFRNLPEGITAEEVARIVQDSTTDDSFVKKLANNITFQREDSKVKAVMAAKTNRARGV